MLRGINREIIFHEEEDYQRFLAVLKQCKEIGGFELFGWCLMDNHVHLLIRAGNEPLSTVMKRIGCRYVFWFNRKNDRVGHLFQDRYRSEAVETEAYFLTALRYIMQNPIKAGLETQMGRYRYSSYGAYCGKPDALTDTAFAGEFFESSAALRAFLEARENADVMDLPSKGMSATDKDVSDWLARLSGCHDAKAFHSLDKAAQRHCVQQLHQRGATIRQIAAATALPKSNIARMAK